jgi:CubicO group peptidase (beta-lactamase class C family)
MPAHDIVVVITKTYFNLRCTHQTTEDYSWDWQKDSAGYTKGQGNLSLTARGFSRIAEMVLNGGSYENKQVVSKEWLKQSLNPWVDISTSASNNSGHGYFWYKQGYSLNSRTIKVSFASGNGGNKIYVIPEFSMVVSIMSRAYGQGRGHRRSREILKAILALQLAI